MDKRELQMLKNYLEAKDINETIKQNTENVYNIIIMYTILETMTDKTVEVSVCCGSLFPNLLNRSYFFGIMLDEKKFKFPPIGPIDKVKLSDMLKNDGFLTYNVVNDICFNSNKDRLEKVFEHNSEKQKKLK